MAARRFIVICLAVAILAACSFSVFSQTEWDRYLGNPVLSPGTAPAWDDVMAAATFVLFHDGIYKMWYEGNNSFGYATSPDGLVWQKHAGNPVMVPGGLGTWDETNIDSPSIVVVGGTYHMWYSGVDDVDDNRIGHATSPDGIVWTRDPANPVIDTDDPFAWDAFEAIHPFVLHEDNLFKMYYNGHDGLEQRIVYATSTDGSAWTKFTSLFMLEPGANGQWDEAEIGPMCVIRANDGYHMWYTAGDDSDVFGIGYATSVDGLTWIKDTVNNPVLERGATGQWDEGMVAVPHVILIDSVLTMWYGGTVDGSTFETGIATSNSQLVPTLLHSYNTRWTGTGVEIRWSLSELEESARFSVLRSRLPGERFVLLPDAGLVSYGTDFSYTDQTVLPGSGYRYRVKLSDEAGDRTLFETELISIPSQNLVLNRITPNPFNPQATIDYTIADAGRVTLGVYDTSGRLVRLLVDAPQSAGRYAETWNGRDQSGAAVASGIYFIRLESRGQVRTKKAILLK